MEKEYTKIEPEEVTKVPPVIILCPKCHKPMTVHGKVEAEAETQDMLFRKRTKTVKGVRYICPNCKTYWDESLNEEQGVSSQQQLLEPQWHSRSIYLDNSETISCCPVLWGEN